MWPWRAPILPATMLTDRALPRPADWAASLRVAAFLVVGVLNAFLVGQALSWIVNQPAAPDWIVLEEAGRRAAEGESLYDWSGWYHYRWSPIVAHLFVFIAPLGLTAWRIAQVAAVLTLRDWHLVALTLVSWPFWFDIETGNTLIFTFVLAVWAIRGSTAASIGYLVLLALIPRPLALPVAAWLLWQRPHLRLPAAAIALGTLGLAGITGQLPEWVGALVGAGSDLGHELNFGPSKYIGVAWVAIGLPLAAWLTWKGRLGLASLAVSPYWLPYYLLMILLEVPTVRHGRAVPEEVL